MDAVSSKSSSNFTFIDDLSTSSTAGISWASFTNHDLSKMTSTVFESMANFTSDPLETNSSTMAMTANFTSAPQETITNPTPYVIAAIFTPIICTLGIVGNITSLVIFRRQPKSTSAYFLLKVLAIFDGLYLASMFTFYEHFLLLSLGITDDSPSTQNYIQMSLQTLKHFVLLFEFETVFIIAIITIDRFLHICLPLRTRRMNTLKNSKIAFWTTFIVSVISTLPRFCENYYVGDYATGEFVLKAEKRAYASTASYNIGYKIIFTTLVFDIIPTFFVIIPFNTAVLRTLNNRQANPVSTQRKASGSTVIIVSMITVFIILKLPGSIGQILWAVQELTPKLGSWFEVFQQVANPLLLLNSAVNFVIYFSMGKEFRKEFYALCCCAKKMNAQSSQKEGMRSISSRSTSFSNIEPGNI